MSVRLKWAFGIIAICLSSCVVAKNNPKSKKRPAKEHFKLLEAYTQRTLSGIPGGPPPETQTHFVIVWQTAQTLETIFWRGESGWFTCQMERAHKLSPKELRTSPPGIEYNTDPPTGDPPHKGDTLMLTPIRGGKFPIPKEIPAKTKNTLFYKTNVSAWLAFPVKNVTKKRDIPMP